jgi:hypothetical protein
MRSDGGAPPPDVDDAPVTIDMHCFDWNTTIAPGVFRDAPRDMWFLSGKRVKPAPRPKNPSA